MPKKIKNLCVDDLRHAEYYGMQPAFDELYRRSMDGDTFTDLMDLILKKPVAEQSDSHRARTIPTDWKSRGI